MSLSIPDIVPGRGKARDMLRAISTGSIRELQYLYRHFDIIPPHTPIPYPSPRSSDSSSFPRTSPPPTLLCLATAITSHQAVILSDLLQTFPAVRTTPELLELCVAEGDVSCLDLLLMHDSSAVDTCVCVAEGDATGASLLHCAVWMSAGWLRGGGFDDGEMARCLLHHGARVDVGAYCGLSVVRCALKAGMRPADGKPTLSGLVPVEDGEDESRDHDDETYEDGARNGDDAGANGQSDEHGSDHVEDEKDDNEDEDDGFEPPDLDLIRDLISRGASVEGALQDAVECGPDYVAAILQGRPKPSAREIREALMGAKKAELVILKERMEEKKQSASVESLRERSKEHETNGNGNGNGMQPTVEDGEEF